MTNNHKSLDCLTDWSLHDYDTDLRLENIQIKVK